MRPNICLLMSLFEVLCMSLLVYECTSAPVAVVIDKHSSVNHTTGIKEEIESYRDVANQIIEFLLNGTGKGQAYKRLALFTDTFGNRISGSKNLENAIDYLIEELQKDGLENVHGENVTVPHWVRGQESATLVEPRNYDIALLSLGGSVGTSPEGMTADVLVVHSFDELHNRSSEAKGKIVVFDQDWVNYGVSVQYRDFAAEETSKVGGIAALVRSVASFSIHSPHTGMQFYKDSIKKIPVACIAVEDAEMLSRMAARGTKIVIKLILEAQTLPDAVSRNTVAEIIGSKYPEQVVLVSGHLDSWDVGQGAMDDGGGAFVSWQALSVIRQLGLRPKRTMRAVFWTGEEQGYVGSQQYYEQHKSNISNYDLVMESDGGTFTPTGISNSGNAATQEIMKQVLDLLSPINATTLQVSTEGGDVQSWMDAGVPGGNLLNQNDRYFWFHHSDGDTMSVQDPYMMDLCAAVWAVVSYVVADMDEMLPR
ncbi:carboxypeptidase Q-like isoform X1 [Apostichopus japonicus]|uniref:carboxypeptidase Q-like isoform X1 n=1 Tax=Stichopus japonicus TaxID=307972 RepID=UPI003AB36803